jgi:hypothetical protein
MSDRRPGPAGFPVGFMVPCVRGLFLSDFAAGGHLLSIVILERPILAARLMLVFLPGCTTMPPLKNDDLRAQLTNTSP